MSNTNKTKNRTALEDLFLYRVEIANGVVDVYAYPIFDQDCSLRHNVDSKNAIHTTLKINLDIEDETIVDVAVLEDNIVTDFGLSAYPFYEVTLWSTVEDVIEELGRKLKATGKI